MALHVEHHPTPVEGCFGCKVLSIGIMSVPGGTRPGSFKRAHERQFAKDMDSYREARRNGEQPTQVSKKAVEEAQKRQESIERGKQKVEQWQ